MVAITLPKGRIEENSAENGLELVARMLSGRFSPDRCDTGYIKTCLTLLSDDAFRFYLPLFLTASLEIPDYNESLSGRATDTRASIIFNLEPPNPITRNQINQEKHMPAQWEEQLHRWQARIGGLNAEQKEAVKYFLQFLKKNTFEENKSLDRALAFFSQEQSKQDSE